MARCAFEEVYEKLVLRRRLGYSDVLLGEKSTYSSSSYV